MNTRVARKFCSLLVASVALAGALPDRGLAQPAAKPAVKRPTPDPSRPGQANEGENGDDPASQPLPEIKPFKTGIDYRPTSPRTRVTFNLEDADLPDLVRLISQITGKRFILPSKSRSIKATVYAPTKVTAAEAYQAFLSILELNGMALVPSGSYLKIVESGRVEGRPIPLYTEESNDVPRGDRFVTRLHHVRNISAEDASQLLERFKSGDGSLTAYAPTNTLIITDTGTNMRRMLRILRAIDVPKTGEQIWVEPIYHATATDLATRLSELFDTEAPSTSSAAKPATARKRATNRRNTPKKAAGGDVSTVGSGGRSGETRIAKILADERTNSLIIVATERAYLRIVQMLKHLDVSMEGEGRIHVHHLQHADAEEVASTLSSLVGGSGGRAAPTAARRGGTPQAAGSVASIFEGKVQVTAHAAANSLVITSSTHDYAALRHVIDQLDTERRQVFIEAVIMELTVNRSSELGLGYHGGVPDAPTEGSLLGLGFQASKSLGGIEGSAASGDFLSGLAVGVQGPDLVGFSLPSFGIALQAIASDNDVNVLSTPHLIATDNVEAEISVGANVPLQTSTVPTLGGAGGLASLAALSGSSDSAGALGGLAGLSGLGSFGSVPRQDVGTTVTITPHINDTDEIRLEIAEEISEAGAPSQTGNLGVVPISRTQAKTETVVRDQETVVIGGLMRDGTTNTVTKVPILGDIPLLGALFRNTQRSKTKRNLLLFLTPYIIRSSSDLRSIYERKMRERQEFLDRYFVFSTAEYEPPVDYSRTRGLLGEIFVELNQLDEQRRLQREAESQPKPVHEARPPVGDGEDLGRVHQELDDDVEIFEPDGEQPLPEASRRTAPPPTSAFAPAQPAPAAEGDGGGGDNDDNAPE